MPQQDIDLLGENREGGVNPPRAQRCEGDFAGITTEGNFGKGRAEDDPKSEDRPVDLYVPCGNGFIFP